MMVAMKQEKTNKPKKAMAKTAIPKNKGLTKMVQNKMKSSKNKEKDARTSSKSKGARPKSIPGFQLEYPPYFFFGGGKADGDGSIRDILGGKGAGLAEMCRAGVPVPPGFTITTEVCRLYYQNNLEVPPEIDRELENQMAKIEALVGAKFGDSNDPLLVSVRSGAKFSMPGMMDTILNLGLNKETLEGLIKKTGDERFAYDNYRRFVQMFGNVVLGIDKEKFEEVIDMRKKERKIKQDSSLQAEDLNDIVKKFKAIIKKKTGESFPDDPYVQLRMARDAVLRSWNNPRAISYRQFNNIPGDLGTAVNIQAMVFGNMGNNSGTGVGFTRNPSTGEKEFYGEYLLHAQGEDVVAGIRTPQPISQLGEEMPDVYKQLKEITSRLERHYRDVQDFEFTIQEKKLYMLQTRTGKRTVQAALKISVDMVREKLITKEEAIMRLDPVQLDQLLHPRLDPSAEYEVIARGLPASPGAASGEVYFTAASAVKAAKGGNSVILVRQETNPDDIEGMNAASGILTSRGGMTSHAAVVARGMGKCCVAGCEAARVSEAKKQLQIGKLIIKEKEIITLNGSLGEVIVGPVATIEPELSGEFAEFMSWADEIRKLKVRANADTPRDAIQARKYGAQGIGLCRTEHMFFAEDRLPIVQDMILADSTEERQQALDKLLPFQKADFKGLFEVMDGLPVTIRTLDPPLHEFLPDKAVIEAEIAQLNKADEHYDELLARRKKVLMRIEELKEINPMLGHRGCRLGIVFPEITEMQVRAIIEAACEVIREKKTVIPEIMIPLVGHINEFKNQKEIVLRIAEEAIKKYKVKSLEYHVGTMIEIPRAALTADEIAAEAEFFSFGTNDLTQMVMGFSRDDAGKFLRYYVDKGILPKDPFVSIDRGGVGKLVEMGTSKGRSVKPDLKIGICGEHGGDPDSIEFCHQTGLDYVSCSPFRVPIARLAAAQATIREKKKTAERDK
ncbi:MAG: pyruvate, phosphate dikinase [candidate division Zixibacteria bacterium]|nr:pyruvate, phosphate dikinase [candidate division Zixibacteria bacterium]